MNGCFYFSPFFFSILSFSSFFFFSHNLPFESGFNGAERTALRLTAENIKRKRAAEYFISDENVSSLARFGFYRCVFRTRNPA